MHFVQNSYSDFLLSTVNSSTSDSIQRASSPLTSSSISSLCADFLYRSSNANQGVALLTYFRSTKALIPSCYRPSSRRQRTVSSPNRTTPACVSTVDDLITVMVSASDTIQIHLSGLNHVSSLPRSQHGIASICLVWRPKQPVA